MTNHGHAPGHVRETFCNAIDAFVAWDPDEPEPMVHFEIGYVPHPIPISKACTLVWNCTDIIAGPQGHALKVDGGTNTEKEGRGQEREIILSRAPRHRGRSEPRGGKPVVFGTKRDADSVTALSGCGVLFIAQHPVGARADYRLLPRLSS
jgi:hypothetical protein